jgi:hypothetical protein
MKHDARPSLDYSAATCHPGCVQLHLGPVTVHLSTEEFQALMLSALDVYEGLRGEPEPLVEEPADEEVLFPAGARLPHKPSGWKH